jgi:putative intracellular protease/amidase/YHS domain-containing protein
MNRGNALGRRNVLTATAGAVGIATLGGCLPGATAASATTAPASPPASSNGAKVVALVLGPDAEVLDFTGPLEVFSASARDGKALFVPYVIADSLRPLTVSGGLRVVPDHAFDSAPAPDVIVIPAQAEPSATMLTWIRQASKGAMLTSSVCNGAFVLARTGLLDGKEATLHHGGYFRFAATFPNVRLRRGARYVEQGPVATAGGVSSGIDLALRVVERLSDRTRAEEVADAIEYQGRGWLAPDSNQAYKKLPPFDEARPVCPVCLMNADRSIEATYRGKRYFFCMAEERTFFLAHTDVFERFLAEDAAG